MKKLLIILLIFIISTPAYAYRKGYYRKDGTWVSPSYGTNSYSNFQVKTNTNIYDWKRMNTQSNTYTHTYKPKKIYTPKTYNYKRYSNPNSIKY